MRMDLRLLLLLGLLVGVALAGDSSEASESEENSEPSEQSSEESEESSAETERAHDDDQRLSNQQVEEEVREEVKHKLGKSYRSAASDAQDLARMRSRNWPNGEVVYKIDNSLLRYKTTIENALAELQAILNAEGECISFRPWTLRDRTYVKVFNGDGCWSDVGYPTNNENPVREMSLGSGCYAKGTIWHEFLHVLGLFHEQSRSDRDNAVNINYGNILSGKEANFEKLLTNRMDLLKKKYDKDSLLHYKNDAFTAVRGKKTIESKSNPNEVFGQRTAPSDEDVAAIRTLYQCDGGSSGGSSRTTARPATTRRTVAPRTTRPPVTRATTTRRTVAPRATTTRRTVAPRTTPTRRTYPTRATVSRPTYTRTG